MKGLNDSSLFVFSFKDARTWNAPSGISQKCRSCCSTRASVPCAASPSWTRGWSACISWMRRRCVCTSRVDINVGFVVDDSVYTPKVGFQPVGLMHSHIYMWLPPYLAPPPTLPSSIGFAAEPAFNGQLMDQCAALCRCPLHLWTPRKYYLASLPLVSAA